MVSFLFAEVGDLEVFVYSLTKYHTLCGPPGWFFSLSPALCQRMSWCVIASIPVKSSSLDIYIARS